MFDFPIVFCKHFFLGTYLIGDIRVSVDFLIRFRITHDDYSLFYKMSRIYDIFEEFILIFMLIY